MTRALVLFAAAVAVAGTGCASGPRLLQRTPGEGVIAMPSNSDSWPTRHRSKALKMIEEHVGSDYEIVSEREVVTGHTTVNRQDTDRKATFNSSMPFLPAEREQTTTTTSQLPQTEWQIAYRRRSATPAIAPAAGGVAPAGK